MRTLSILLVMTSHWGFMRFGLHVDTPRTMPVYPRYWIHLMRNGIYGVSLFFLISGFLITRVLVGPLTEFSRISLKEFYVRRAGRVLPLLGAILLFGSVVVLFFAARLKSDAFDFIFHGRPSWGMWISMMTFSFNGYRIWHERIAGALGLHWDVLWSLSIEEQFYLFYPLLLKSLRKTKSVIVVLLGIMVLGPIDRWLCFRVAPADRLLGLCNSFAAFDLIAMGCLLFFLHRQIGEKLRQRPGMGWTLLGAGSTILAGTYFFTSIWANASPDRIYGPTLIDTGLFLMLLGGLSLDLKLFSRFRLLCIPGELSYGMYLWHATVLYLAYPFLKRWTPWVSDLWFIVMTTAWCYISSRWYERPVNRWIRHMGKPA